MKLFSKSAAIFVTTVLCIAFSGCKISTNEENSTIPTTQDDNLSGTDTEFLARYIYESNAGENLKNEYEAESGYDLWISPRTGKVYAYPSEWSIEHIYVTFKSENEEQNQAYFYVTAKTGYFIQNSDAVQLPEKIDADKLELNPETNYWRYK